MRTVNVVEAQNDVRLVDDEAVEQAKSEMQEWYASRTEIGTCIAIGIKTALRILDLLEEDDECDNEND